MIGVQKRIREKLISAFYTEKNHFEIFVFFQRAKLYWRKLEALVKGEVNILFLCEKMSGGVNSLL